jgi:hypothetical protein
VPISSRSIARKPPETTGLFDAARLAHMKRTAFILDGKPIRDKVVNKKVLGKHQSWHLQTLAYLDRKKGYHRRRGRTVILEH